MKKILNAIDIFSGCGGLSEGLQKAGFRILVGIENNHDAATIYKLNHKKTILFEKDIRKVNIDEIKIILKGKTLHLIAGCPPCQGFSSIRRLNKKDPVEDERNNLILEYKRFVIGLKPWIFMLENVPGLLDFKLFQDFIHEMNNIGYIINKKIIDVADYGVPQRRKRLVVIGSKKREIKIAPGLKKIKTVRDVIGSLESVNVTCDPIHKIYASHTERIKSLISLIPKNGGSRKDLPKELWLKCHMKSNIGFNDVYGRLSWDSVSSTITGGCLNPSKGRFLHPEENRCITAREAALLQTFPRNYRFSTNINKKSLALIIGNALPPLFSKIQAKHIIKYIY
ncbi:MAG: DNA cytosine methyltransferase [Candidatus Lokiarchaeota archaeon]|nr:DNA cytosine methyltransferase [Candidatus Lokiarchaeota archaeon]